MKIDELKFDGNRYIKDCGLIESDDDGYDEVLLWADFKEGRVYTNCSDSYYNYSIPFDDFIKFAEFIKKEQENGTRPK